MSIRDEFFLKNTEHFYFHTPAFAGNVVTKSGHPFSSRHLMATYDVRAVADITGIIGLDSEVSYLDENDYDYTKLQPGTHIYIGSASNKGTVDVAERLGKGNIGFDFGNKGAEENEWAIIVGGTRYATPDPISYKGDETFPDVGLISRIGDGNKTHLLIAGLGALATQVCGNRLRKHFNAIHLAAGPSNFANVEFVDPQDLDREYNPKWHSWT